MGDEPFDAVELVAALRGVPGIRDAGLEPDGEAWPGTLRLDLADGADEVDVAVRVGQLLREDFGLGIDTGDVRVVEDAAWPPADPAEPWAAVDRMQLVSAGREVTASVTLARDGILATGECSGDATSAGVHRAVAEATLRAAGLLADTDSVGALEVVDVVTTEGVRTARVSLVLTAGERVESAAPVQADARQAIIRAVLAALRDLPTH